MTCISFNDATLITWLNPWRLDTEVFVEAPGGSQVMQEPLSLDYRQLVATRLSAFNRNAEKHLLRINKSPSPTIG